MPGIDLVEIADDGGATTESVEQSSAQPRRFRRVEVDRPVDHDDVGFQGVLAQQLHKTPQFAKIGFSPRWFVHMGDVGGERSGLHDAIEAFGRGPECWGLVHGDLHQWNLLFVRGAAGAIDFTDCGMGHHAMDLAATLQYLRYPLACNHDHRRQYPALHDALLRGYAAEHTPSPGLAQQISVLVTARLFLTLAWIWMTGPLWITVRGGLDSSAGRSGRCVRGWPPHLAPDARTVHARQA